MKKQAPRARTTLTAHGRPRARPEMQDDPRQTTWHIDIERQLRASGARRALHDGKDEPPSPATVAEAFHRLIGPIYVGRARPHMKNAFNVFRSVIRLMWRTNSDECDPRDLSKLQKLERVAAPTTTELQMLYLELVKRCAADYHRTDGAPQGQSAFGFAHGTQTDINSTTWPEHACRTMIVEGATIHRKLGRVSLSKIGNKLARLKPDRPKRGRTSYSPERAADELAASVGLWRARRSPLKDSKDGPSQPADRPRYGQKFRNSSKRASRTNNER